MSYMCGGILTKMHGSYSLAIPLLKKYWKSNVPSYYEGVESHKDF